MSSFILSLFLTLLFVTASARTIRDSTILRSAVPSPKDEAVTYSLTQKVHEPFAATTSFSFADGANSFNTTNGANSFSCDPSVRQITGYLELSRGGKKTKRYFFWFFESQRAPKNDPVLLWMTGGPGCSSEVALFGENGPCKVVGDGSTGETKYNPFGWNKRANLLYIDQPAGTGFSIFEAGEKDRTEEQVSSDMDEFLQLFFAKNGYRDQPFYAFGESYGGHYIPATTHKVWENNKKRRALLAGSPPLSKEERDAITVVNLQGLGVGNGLTDLSVQLYAYPEMAVSTNHHTPAVSQTTYATMKLAAKIAGKAVEACNSWAPWMCPFAGTAVNLGLVAPYASSGKNSYDMREQCKVPPMCYDFSPLSTLLNEPKVQRALGVPEGMHWESCNMDVNLNFQLSGDWSRDYQKKLPELLADNVRVLIYAGDQDYICNWLGNQAWTRAMEWSGKASFNSAPVKEWKVKSEKGSEAAGTSQSSNGFTFLRVFDAGHMVPMDQPRRALAMLDDFLSGGTGAGAGCEMDL